MKSKKGSKLGYVYFGRSHFTKKEWSTIIKFCNGKLPDPDLFIGTKLEKGFVKAMENHGNLFL